MLSVVPVFLGCRVLLVGVWSMFVACCLSCVVCCFGGCCKVRVVSWIVLCSWLSFMVRC